MRQHQDWRSPGFEFPALAEATGPFATSGFLSTIWEAWSETSGELVIAESADSLVCLEVVDDGVRPVGHRDLVDYRTPLGGMAGNLFGLLESFKREPLPRIGLLSRNGPLRLLPMGPGNGGGRWWLRLGMLLRF